MILSLLNKVYRWFIPANVDENEVVVCVKRYSTDISYPEHSCKRVKFTKMENNRKTSNRTRTSQRNKSFWSRDNDVEIVSSSLSGTANQSSATKKSPIEVVTISDDESDENDIYICDDGNDNEDVICVSSAEIPSKSSCVSSSLRVSNKVVDLTDEIIDLDDSTNFMKPCSSVSTSGIKNVAVACSSPMSSSVYNGNLSSSIYSSSNKNYAGNSMNMSVGSQNGSKYSTSRDALTLSESIRMQDKELYKNLLKQAANMNNGGVVPCISPKSLRDETLLSLVLSNKSNASRDNSFAAEKLDVPKKTHIDVNVSRLLPSSSSKHNQPCDKCHDSNKKYDKEVPLELSRLVKKNDTTCVNVAENILQLYALKEKERNAKIVELKESLKSIQNKQFNEQLEARLKQLRILNEPEEKIPSPEPLFVLPPITDDMRQEVMKITQRRRNEDVLFSNEQGTIHLSDIKTLRGLNWLNDEVINTYMNLIIERSSKPGYQPVHCFNTFFYQRLQAGYSVVRRWTKKIDIFSKDLVIAPIHLSIHWCLVCIDLRNKTINYYDSMGSSNPTCLKTFFEYLKEEHKDKKKSEFDTKGWKFVNLMSNSPQQENGSDCGVFACTTAEFISRKAPLNFSQKDMPYFRQKMTYELLKGKLIT